MVELWWFFIGILYLQRNLMSRAARIIVALILVHFAIFPAVKYREMSEVYRGNLFSPIVKPYLGNFAHLHGK